MLVKFRRIGMKDIHDLEGAVGRREVLLGINGTLLMLGATTAAPSLSSQLALPTRGVFKVREIENSWLPMPDGVKLAARIWLPDNPQQPKVPAILNYCPYFA